MQVCTSLQTDNHASTPLLSFLPAGCPSCRPTNSVKALKANLLSQYHYINLISTGYRLTRVGPEKRPLNGCTSSAVIRGETDLEHEVAGRYTTIASVVSAAAHSSDCSHRTPGCMSSRRGTLAASSAERRPRRLGDALMDQSTNCYNSHKHATFCKY